MADFMYRLLTRRKIDSRFGLLVTILVVAALALGAPAWVVMTIAVGGLYTYGKLVSRYVYRVERQRDLGAQG